MPGKIYTVGHSNHDIAKFLGLLQSQNVKVLADVRSIPVSNYVPHYNQPALREALAKQKISYVFMGDQLGARSDDPACYSSAGVVSFDKLAESSCFQAGIKRLEKGIATHAVAVMCSEKDPIMCHRTILVARHLQMRGIEVVHILEDQSTESHNMTEERLLKLFKMTSSDLFKSPDELLDDAYRRQEQKIAYTTTNTHEFNPENQQP